MKNLETEIEKEGSQRAGEYIRRCFNPENARLYGNFQERAALNTTQFHKIQGSLLIRMGMIYPLASYAVEALGLPNDSATEIAGMGINYHTWAAGYLAYLLEIQAGLSKYPIELIGKGIGKLKNRFSKKDKPSESYDYEI